MAAGRRGRRLLLIGCECLELADVDGCWWSLEGWRGRQSTVSWLGVMAAVGESFGSGLGTGNQPFDGVRRTFDVGLA